jgi:hypothetical protein
MSYILDDFLIARFHDLHCQNEPILLPPDAFNQSNAPFAEDILLLIAKLKLHVYLWWYSYNPNLTTE